MASPSEHRRQKALAKQKKRREVAQESRRRRQDRAHAPRSEAAKWPLFEAWISQDWHEWEARVHGVVARRHADGVVAWAAFEVDLADDGLVATESQVGVEEGFLRRALIQRSEAPVDGKGGSALVSTDAAEVARLAHDALGWRRRRKLADPRGLEDALAVLGDVDPDDATFEFLFGREDEEEETAEVPARQSLWTKLRSMFS